MADYFSRNPINQHENYTHEDIAERYINMISSSCLPKAISRKEMIEATLNDKELINVKKMLNDKIAMVNDTYNRLKRLYHKPSLGYY